MNRPDKVKVTTYVDVSPVDAFDVFTQEVDRWWRKGPRFRFGGVNVGVLRFEPREGGTLTEGFDDGTSYSVGKILAWEPGARLVFEWHGRNFTADQRTEVEVRFVAKNGGTEVALEHRGWSTLPDSHPARHGNVGRAFTDMLGLWWGELVTSYRAHTRARPRPS